MKPNTALELTEVTGIYLQLIFTQNIKKNGNRKTFQSCNQHAQPLPSLKRKLVFPLGFHKHISLQI